MKTVFITGATAGFGKALAEIFIKANYQVIATGRRSDRLEKLKKDLGENLHIETLDIQNKDAVKKTIANLPERFSRIDILINNAGLAIGTNPIQKGNLEDWSTMINTNINGLLYVTHSILPIMLKNNSGHIFNLGSVAGSYPYPGGNIYGATKAFVEQLSLNMRADLLGSKIRVTNIEPGMCETEFSLVRFDGDDQKAKSVYAGMTPLSAQDIAETIFWISQRPAHVNINTIELMPVEQAFGAFSVHRS